MPPQPLPWKDATNVGRGKSKAPRLAPLTTAAALTGLAAGAATGAATLAVCVPVLGGEIHGNLGGWFQETMALWGTIDAKTERDTKIISKTSRCVLFFSVLHFMISYHFMLYLHHYIYIYIKNIISDFGGPQFEPHATPGGILTKTTTGAAAGYLRHLFRRRSQLRDQATCGSFLLELPMVTETSGPGGGKSRLDGLVVMSKS